MDKGSFSDFLKKHYRLLIAYSVFVVLLAISMFHILGKTGIDLWDLEGQSRLCAYAIRGVDPYKIIGKSEETIEGMGTIPNTYATVPWGLILGMIFYPGIAPGVVLNRLFLAINVICIVITTIIVLYVLYEERNSYAFFAALLTLLAPDYLQAMDQGNAGGMIGCMLLLAFVLCKNCPILSGICLAVAMIKPQCAFPVCLAFFFLMEWKPLLVAATIDLISLFSASAIVHVNFIDLILEFLTSNVGGGKFWAGIFEPLRYVFEHHRLLLIFSMSFGVCFIVFTFWFTRKSENASLILFTTSFFTATFWSYAWLNDGMVLIVPSLVILYCILNEIKPARQSWLFVCLCYCYFGQVIIWRLDLLLKKSLKVEAIDAHTLYEIGIIGITVALIIYLQQHKTNLVFIRRNNK